MLKNMRANTKTHRETQPWRVRLVRLVPTEGRSTSSRRALELGLGGGGNGGCGDGVRVGGDGVGGGGCGGGVGGGVVSGGHGVGGGVVVVGGGGVGGGVGGSGDGVGGGGTSAAAAAAWAAAASAASAAAWAAAASAAAAATAWATVAWAVVAPRAYTYEIDERPCLCTWRTVAGAARASPAARARRWARVSTLAAAAALGGRSGAVAVGWVGRPSRTPASPTPRTHRAWRHACPAAAAASPVVAPRPGTTAAAVEAGSGALRPPRLLAEVGPRSSRRPNSNSVSTFARRALPARARRGRSEQGIMRGVEMRGGVRGSRAYGAREGGGGSMAGAHPNPRDDVLCGRREPSRGGPAGASPRGVEHRPLTAVLPTGWPSQRVVTTP